MHYTIMGGVFRIENNMPLEYTEKRIMGKQYKIYSEMS